MDNSLFSQLGNGSVSMTDVTLEQALEKVQELAAENTNLRDYLKENNDSVKKQFNILMDWKEKVRESNQNNLKRFEEQKQRITELTKQNEYLRQQLLPREEQGSVLEELQTRIRQLEEEKNQTQRECMTLQQKVEELRNRVAPEIDTVFVNKLTDDDDFSLKLRTECEAYKQRCSELQAQVENFHQQNEQLILDLQHITNLKQNIQDENTKINEQNLQLQKRMQSFLGDMKNSIGGSQQEAYKAYDYSMLDPGSETEVVETKSSVTAKQDLEILELQRQASIQDELVRSSEELTTSALAEQLKEKLRAEKMSNSEKRQQLQDKISKISKLQAQLHEKDELLNHYKQQTESQVARVTEAHQRQQQELVKQLDGLNSELHQAKTSIPYGEADVQNLKSQVLTLIKEAQESSAKLTSTTRTLEKKSARVVELEQHIHLLQKDNEQIKIEAEQLIQSLRYSVAANEEACQRERSEHATTKKQLVELRASFNQLVGDYKELLDTFDEYKAHQQTQVQPGGQNKQLMDDINRLTAQTIAAEEAIAYRDDQIKKLKEENVKMKDEIDNTLPILRAQADVWKQDFDAERNARERQVQEKESILQEMKNLQTQNQQLLDEIEGYSRRSLAEMQRRHVPQAGSHQQQIRAQLQGSPTGYPQQYPQNQPPYPQGSPQNPQGQPQGQPPGQPQYPTGPGHPPGQVPYPQQGQPQYPPPQQPLVYPHMYQPESPRAEIQARPPPSPQPTSRQSGSSHQEEAEPQMSCPKCGMTCPDLDTLQIHVLDCIDN